MHNTSMATVARSAALAVRRLSRGQRFRSPQAVSAFRRAPGHGASQVAGFGGVATHTPKTDRALKLKVTASSANERKVAAKAVAVAVAAPVQKAVSLSQSVLGEIDSAGHASVPTFNRDLTADTQVIVHLGVGGFFRSHQALYLHQLRERGSNWGFVGMGILDFDLKMYEALKSQDYLYTLMSKGDGHPTRFSVVGSILDYVYAPDDLTAAVERMAHMQTKIVSLTITEKGYCWDSDGNLDKTNEYVIRDMADVTQPASAMGFIVAALKLRKERGQKPFTVLSCDNMPDNGHVARRMCTQLADVVDPELSAWITDNVPFPVTMVDRITPITLAPDRDEVKTDAQIVDKWPVVAEDFMQWVIEDKFIDGCRPEFELAGALVVDDVTPYEFMKLRLLNGGHSALSYAAYMLAYREVHTAMADPRISTFLRCYFSEVAQTLPAVPGVDIEEYQDTLVKRFSNVYIQDQVQRLSQDGSAKLYNTMKDTIIELVAAGKPIDTICLAFAGFGRYMTGVDEEGEPIVILDPLAEKLRPLACNMFAVGEDSVCLGSESTKEFVHAVFGTDLSTNETFLDSLEAWACIMRDVGMKGSLAGLCIIGADNPYSQDGATNSCEATYDEEALERIDFPFDIENFDIEV